MRLSPKLAGLLLAGTMAAGVTAAAVPADASTSSNFWEIITLPQGIDGPLLCLQGGSQGSAVIQQPCDPNFASTEQQWVPISQGGDVFKFENVASGLCMDAHGSASDDVPVIMWSCTANISNTRWQWPIPSNHLQDTFPGLNPIQSRVSGSTGFCLDVPLAQTLPGLQMQIQRCNGTAAQDMWITHPVS